MSKKTIIKLTESDLKNIITESVKRVLKESNFYDDNPEFYSTSTMDYPSELIELLSQKNQDYYGAWVYARNLGIKLIKDGALLYGVGTNDGENVICTFRNNTGKGFDIPFYELPEEDQELIISAIRNA